MRVTERAGEVGALNLANHDTDPASYVGDHGNCSREAVVGVLNMRAIASSDRTRNRGEGRNERKRSLYERLAGIYGIADALDMLTGCLYHNAAANNNPIVLGRGREIKLT